MGSVIPGARKLIGSARSSWRARGFTLLELLVVLVIVGLVLGFVSINAIQSEQQALQKEAQRIALLLQLAREEAIVRNRPIAFEADSNSYRFLVRDEEEWHALPQDDLLRERSFPRPPVTLTMSPARPAEDGPLRIIFGREPVDKPFVLTLSSNEASVAIRADGIGNFSVE